MSKQITSIGAPASLIRAGEKVMKQKMLEQVKGDLEKLRTLSVNKKDARSRLAFNVAIELLEEKLNNQEKT